MPLYVSSTSADRQEAKIVLYSLWYTASGIITLIGVMILLIVRRPKLYYTASGIITLIGVMILLIVRRPKLYYTASGIITP